MAIQQHEQEEAYPSFLLDGLYCEEDEVLEEGTSLSAYNNGGDFDLFWEDEELVSLFSKEMELGPENVESKDDEVLTTVRREVRREAVEWMLKVNAHYGFTTLTAVLSVNYLDRFLSSFCFQRDKPWMIHLVAVTCLSLAAKVEETHVPLLLDLQVEGTKCVFEAKTIQRMELLVLSTLKWKMHPITPLSFVDHIVRRLGLRTHLHWEFLKRCEHLLLCVISDSRSVQYLPSVLATATMMHVIDLVEIFNPVDYQNQLLNVLKKNKEQVNDCYKLILDLSTRPQNQNNACNGFFFGRTLARHNHHKRKLETAPGSPSGVIDVDFSSDSSNESWVVGQPPSSLAPSVSSSPEPPFRKRRSQERGMRLTSLNLVDIVGNGSPS